MPEPDSRRALAASGHDATLKRGLVVHHGHGLNCARYATAGRGHQILAMWTHLPALDSRPMDPASAWYMIRINGHLGATLLSAFPAMAWQRQGAVTVLTGVLDWPGLYGVLAAIEALGLDLLEVRQLNPEGDCRSVTPAHDEDP